MRFHLKATVVLLSLAARARRRTGGRARNARCDAPDEHRGRLADDSADRPEGRPDQAEPDQGQAAARLPHFALRAGAGRPPHRGRSAGHRDVRRHAQDEGLRGDRSLPRRRRRRGEGVRADAAEEDSQRPVLLEGRLPLRRRAEPRRRVSGGRILLRKPGRRAERDRARGRADSQRRGELQPHGASVPGRPRQQALHPARVSRTTCRPRTSSACTRSSASAGSSGWIATARIARSMRPGFAIPWAWTSIRRTRRCGPTTTRWTAWATTSRPAR